MTRYPHGVMVRNALPRIAFTLVMAGGLVLACDPTSVDQTVEPGASTAATADPHAPAADSRLTTPNRQSPLAEFRAIGEALYAGSNRYLGHATLDDFRRTIADPGSSFTRRIKAKAALARRLLELGEIDRAVATVEEIHGAIAPADLEGMTNLHWLRGIVYLRQAELANCIANHHADHCIFPLGEASVHTSDQPARNAQASLLRVLEQKPSDLRARWLLNITAMAAGTHDELPERFRIASSAFDSEDVIPRFRDIAPDLGIDTFNLCGGVIVEDFDGDNALDILTSTYDPLGSLTFYHNAGDGSFEDRSVQSHANEQLGGLNMVPTDYDNDGDVDVLILRGAWLFDDGRIRNSLLRNNGDGSFTDVTADAGMARPAFPTQAAAWADFDNDGDLDVYIGNESRLPAEAQADFPGQLFINNGDGTFSDTARSAGVTNDRYCKGVSAGDYDNDGDIDLYLSNVGPNRLFQNQGDATFIEVTSAAGVSEPARRSFATWFFDYDNDGWLDLFVAAYQAGIHDLALQALGRNHQAAPPRLYRNNRDGTFTNVAASVGLHRVMLPMGANFGDLDNDGWLDIYLTTGDPQFETLMPNLMLRNDRGRRFLDVTTAGGFGHLQKGHGTAFVDIDDDGDQDVYHQLGGFFPGDKYQNVLFQNPGNDNHWITIRLRGRESNRPGFGARIHLTLNTPDGTRHVHRAVGAVSSFGGSPFRQEIGLGNAISIEQLEIVWPRSGTHQTFTDVPLDTSIIVREGADIFDPAT